MSVDDELKPTEVSIIISAKFDSKPREDDALAVIDTILDHMASEHIIAATRRTIYVPENEILPPGLLTERQRESLHPDE